mmetsp:Transcript_22005/g.33394  ORF Transcript_22005/g.33394 Transcript_22005/m.33394 type:complete len:176 (-) Transcript_22005:596-1123(-)
MTSILPNLCPSTGLAKFNDVHEVEHSSDSLLLMHPFMNEITEQGIANGDAADLVSAVAAKALAGETEAAVEQRQLDQRPAKRQKTSAGPTDPNEPAKFRPYQAEKWQERFEELKEFTQVHGHCLVPHTYPEHPELARWVKRQRYQYGLLNQGKKIIHLTRPNQDFGRTWFCLGFA